MIYLCEIGTVKCSLFLTPQTAWVTSCTLGHGLVSDAVIAHPYFGDWQRVVADLSHMRGFENGCVRLEAAKCCVKDAEGRVCRMVQE